MEILIIIYFAVMTVGQPGLIEPSFVRSQLSKESRKTSIIMSEAEKNAASAIYSRASDYPDVWKVPRDLSPG